MKTIFPFSIILLLVSLSCQTESQKQLDRAEALLSEAPDIALCVISRIDTKTLHRERDLARYALLKSAALDKNYVDVTSDSLTRKAVDYYSLRADKYHRMLAWYYHGLVLMNAQSYSSAMVAFEKAESDATLLKDDFHSGLILRNKAKVFNLTNDFPEAIACQRKAIRHYEKAGKEAYQSFADVDLAIYYTNNKDYRLADSLFSLIRVKYDNPVLTHYCDIRQAGILVELDHDPQEALSLYKNVPRSYFSVLDYALLSLAHEGANQKDSADFWMLEGYRIARDQADSAALDYPRSQLELKRGHDRLAYRLVDHASSVQDSLTRILLQQSVSAAQRDYFKSETSLREEKIRAIRQKSLFITALSLLAVLALALVAVSISQKKDRRLKEEMVRLALAQRELERVNKDNAHLVGSLFSEKLDHFEKLSETYFRMEEGKQKDLLLRKIKQLASAIRKDDVLFLSLEKDLNRYCQGILSKLQDQVPRIKGENKRIITLFFAGFSYDTVQFILCRHSVPALKTARSRFRKEIQAANAPDAELFLKMLTIKKRPQDGTNEIK